MALCNISLMTCGKKIEVYTADQSDAPIVYLNTVHGEGGAVWKVCQEIDCPPFTLAAISALRWDHDMSPWAIPPISEHDTPCTGGADAYLHVLTESMIPAVEARLPHPPSMRCIAGYSLAGLFAVYSLYQTHAFSRVASASGSFWFPDFVPYAMQHPMCEKPECMYFSLGDSEAKTRNHYLQTVEENTRVLEQYYAGMGVDTTFTLNPGNHFTQPNERMAMGIRWMLMHTKTID